MPKRKIALAFSLIALLAIFLYLTKLSSPDITNYPSKNTGIVAFGDSLVEGVGSARGGGFVSILSDELNMPITNLGVSGNTTAEALGRIGMVTARKPAVVIVLLGGNDYLRRVPRAETEESLARIIESIQAFGAAVILVGVDSGLVLNRDEELFERLSEKYHTAYVPDILEDILGRSGLMADSLHPNDAGYKIMAERIKPVLERLID
jgi:acyl-CoA thioesterase I